MKSGGNGDQVVVLCNELSILAGVELLVLVREGETGVLIALFDRRTPSPLLVENDARDRVSTCCLKTNP